MPQSDNPLYYCAFCNRDVPEELWSYSKLMCTRCAHKERKRITVVKSTATVFAGREKPKERGRRFGE